VKKRERGPLFLSLPGHYGHAGPGRQCPSGSSTRRGPARGAAAPGVDRSRQRRGDDDGVDVVVINAGSGNGDDGDFFFFLRQQLPPLDRVSVCPSLLQGGPPWRASCFGVRGIWEITLDTRESRLAIDRSLNFPDLLEKKKKNSTTTKQQLRPPRDDALGSPRLPLRGALSRFSL